MAGTVAPYTLSANNKVPQAYIPIILSGSDASAILLPGKTGSVIEVWGCDIFVTGATTLDFLSGATDISGAIILPALFNYQWGLPFGKSLEASAAPRCITADGQNLVMTNSAPTVIGGTIWVIQRATSVTF